MRAPRRLLAAVVLVGLGRLLSPAAVPVYDGIGAPDEPYRYVVAPAGTPHTAAATSAEGHSPVVAGRSSYGLQLQTAESGPQFALFLPPGALAAAAGPVVVRAVPEAPTTQPVRGTIDGNVYLVTMTARTGAVTLTNQAALATLYLRATTGKQPPPVIVHRADAAAPWVALQTSRVGMDAYATGFRGPGEYAVAFLAQARKGGSSPAPYIALGGLVLLVVVVVGIRLRAAG